ncbi:hypothetical protein Pint_21459 [Pistacia integerrima]|uniref:Uncharacterized protein n=1 Tax=Pistacia integerrima TaxID=434235 RepID=A0ACC0X8N3_9ROSI|nr:hypothetical protein Pint_21459 [Pistacia integerrima]
MVRTGVSLDDHTFPFVLKTCADNLELQKGMEMHGRLFKLGFETDVFVGNTLLLFYGNCGLLENVKSVFDEMRERDIVSWNTIIGVFSVNGCYVEALDLFCDMIFGSGFKPNSVSVVSILPVCGSLANEAMVKQIHCYAVKIGLDVQVTISNALVDVYGKCGNVMASRKVFDEMAERNEVSWNAIIASLAHTGCNKDALNMFTLMICAGLTPNSIAISSILPVLVELELFSSGKEIHGFSLRMGIESDVFVANSLIDMYAKSGHPSEASCVFHYMPVKNVVTWNAMIANFTQNGLQLAALELVRAMPVHNKIPNSVTLTNVLPACARVGFLRPGKEIHAVTIRMGFNFDLFVTNALTDMYAKCGCLDLAQSVFNISLRDEISYNILIASYAETSDCSKSLSLFSEMGLIGMLHDVVSFVGAISACANLAAIKQGKEIHGVVMRNLFHAHLFVANSLLGFYSRCGRIDIADKIFERIPNKDAASWNTMILGYGMLVLASGLFDGVTCTSFFLLAFLGYERSTSKNPATILEALLGDDMHSHSVSDLFLKFSLKNPQIVILMLTGNNITRPFRVAGAAVLAPFIEKGLKKIQYHFKFPNLVYAFALVVSIVGASCLTAAGFLTLSRWGKLIKEINLWTPP